MIERVGEIAGVAIAMPSSGQSLARRQQRLKWLGSLRSALKEAGPLVDELGPSEAVVQTRARIDDALSVVDEMRARLGAASEDGEADVAAAPVAAADLGRRIAASGERSLAAQARLGPASVRRFVDEGR